MSFLHWGKFPEVAEWLTPAVLDSLGAGSLLACLARRQDGIVIRVAKFMLIVSVLGLIAVFFAPRLGFLKQPFCALGFAWLIWTCSRGFPGAFGRFLSSKPMVHVGSISYGVYLIHGFALPLWNWLCFSSPLPFYRVFDRLHPDPLVWQSGWFSLMGMATLTLGIAALSYRFYEKPISSLKKRFPYRPTSV